jgi:hypothetical protein
MSGSMEVTKVKFRPLSGSMEAKKVKFIS